VEFLGKDFYICFSALFDLGRFEGRLPIFRDEGQNLPNKSLFVEFIKEIAEFNFKNRTNVYELKDLSVEQMVIVRYLLQEKLKDAREAVTGKE